MILGQGVTFEKAIRADVIKEHLILARRPMEVVCFSCGNAASSLRAAGLDVIEVGPNGPIEPTKWWTPTAIARSWPGRFDATSGHLPVYMMESIGRRVVAGIRARHPKQFVVSATHEVPCGSGETLVCMALAAPVLRLRARYDDRAPGTTYAPMAPLNGLVRQLAVSVRGLPRRASSRRGG